MELKKIIANLPSLTKEQLWDEIQQGNAGLSDLINSGCFPVSDERCKWIKAQMLQLDSRDDEAWEHARYGNEMQLSDYLANYGKHAQEAKEKIQYLE